MSYTSVVVPAGKGPSGHDEVISDPASQDQNTDIVPPATGPDVGQATDPDIVTE